LPLAVVTILGLTVAAELLLRSLRYTPQPV
jgi:hypothetical protein